MQVSNGMEQTLCYNAEDVSTGCNDLRSLLGSIKRSDTSIESDLDSGYQDVSLDNRSVTPAMSKNSHDDSDIDVHDNSEESIELRRKDPWSYEELMKTNNDSPLFNAINLPHNWNELKRTKRLEILTNEVERIFPNLPKTLVIHAIGTLFPGDSGKLLSEVPDWLNKEKFFRGQRFANDNTFGIMYANCLSLYILYSFDDSLKPIILTGRSSDPYTSFKRFLSTANRVKNWQTSDPWTEGTPAYRDIQSVRRLHANVRNKLKNLTISQLNDAARIDKPLAVKRNLLLQDFRDACPAAKPGQCPYLMPQSGDARPKGLNQGEMSLTTFGFIGLLILYPEAFGIHNTTEEDLDAFCHFWRGLTYLLGISDEFNVCNGSFQEIKQCSSDFLDFFVKPNLRDITPEFEHMMRCVYEGLNFHTPGTTYDGGLLYLTEIMGLEMPRLRASMTYSAWIKFNLTKTVFRYSCRFKWIKDYLNRRTLNALDRASAFDDDKHAQLRETSKKIVSTILVDTHIDKFTDISHFNI